MDPPPFVLRLPSGGAPTPVNIPRTMSDNKLKRFVGGDLSPVNGASAQQQSASSAAGGEAAGINLSEIVDTLRRGKWIIAATMIVVACAVGGYTYTLDPIYESNSIVKIDLGMQAGGVAAFSQQRDLSSEVGVLEYSAELASRVVDELRTTEEALGQKNHFPILYDGSGRDLPTNQVIMKLLQSVRFQPMPSQNMIRLIVESKVPEEASTIANVYAAQYEAYSREKARASVAAAREFLEDQANKRRSDIRTLEGQWEAFAQSNQVVTQGLGGERLVAEYTELSARRDQLGFELDHEREALRILRNQLAQFEPGLRESVQKEQAATGLRSEIQVLENRIGEMRAEAAQYYVANDGLEGDVQRIQREFPDLADLLRNVDGLEQRKRTLTDQLVAQARQTSAGAIGSASDDVAAGGALERVGQLRQRITEQEIKIGQLEAQIAGLNDTIDGYQPRLSRIPQQTIQREALDRKLQQAEQFYQSITTELQRTIIAEESELGYVQIVRKAFVPGFPVRPNVTQNLILGLLLGIGFGIGLAFIREASTSQIHRPDDLVRHGYTVTGVIPDMAAEIKNEFRGQPTVEIEGHTLSTSLLPILSPWSPVTENYRLVRTNLQYSAGVHGDAPQVIMVTSPEPGDGKSTTAVNLALTFVLSGKKVLLIDGDMRRPTTHKLLGTERGPGLAEMLHGGERMQVVRRTYIDGLYYVPAGHAEDPPTEALDSEQMRRLIALGRERCDVIIIDTPPVLAASDPLVLAPVADATIVVTSAEKTDVKALDLTRDMLAGVGVPITGVIFNRFEEQKGNRANYRYGYYKYDQYKMVS